MMNLGSRGEKLIKDFEDLVLTSYRSSPTDRWSIGWGHTHGVVPGMSIDEEAAQRFFEQDIYWIVGQLNTLNIPTQSMFDALISLCYNVGLSPLSGRTKIGWAIRQKMWFDVWAHMAQWRKIGNADSLGLARRRAAEMVLFLEDGIS